MYEEPNSEHLEDEDLEIFDELPGGVDLDDEI